MSFVVTSTLFIENDPDYFIGFVGVRLIWLSAIVIAMVLLDCFACPKKIIVKTN